MGKTAAVKFISWILLLVVMTVTLHCVTENAHAVQNCLPMAGDPTSCQKIQSHQCPCSPPEQDQNHNDCDACINCVCHAPLTVQQFHLSYKPIIISFSSSDPFKHLPEVYLSKFVPPQNQA
ncbi:hypothetical protein Geob_0855 [Geotalea daltonii FRC-32]|uniref:Uncharacterized protein n=1 Tax=Geotalea daltonii (strain DSM 22248 / JCM 15807 / FRC-32) TaxID=316067 RepID=B9M1S1_GEODF|nr:hypothetical protein Geob_0855 [Geotalea daltonii FRC-32]